VRLAAAALGVVSLLSWGVAVVANHGHTDLTSPRHTVVAAVPRVATPPPPAPVVDPLSGVVAAMATAMAAQPSLQASASLINLDTGNEYDAGSNSTPFTAASTAKLVAVFDYIHQVELGKATLTQNIGGMSGQDNIMRMIVYSDNDAWARLNKYLTFRGEQAYLSSLAVTAVVQQDNMQFTTPNMARLLQLLYTGQLMNSAHRQLVYGYMTHTTVTNLIQAALPGTATVYHKYGQLYGNLHDAAIVQYAGHNFVLVIYTNNPSNTSSRYSSQVNLIHAVTTAVFQAVTAS